MIWLVGAGFIYLVALYGTVYMVQAETAGETLMSLLAGLCAAVLWVTAMYMIFRGLVEVGVFNVLTESR